MNGNINEFSTEEETPSESINSSANNILLYRNDQPNIIIEKVLISIYNQNINPDNSSKEELDMGLCFEQVKKLCSKYEEYHIVLLLLKGIRSLIYKYREIILKLPNIEEIKGKENYFEYPLRSNSYKNKFPKEPKIKEYFKSGNRIAGHSPKNSRYSPLLGLFSELNNIKNCLKKSAPIIEMIFEIPLSKFKKFSIEECEKEDYYSILIKDRFIWSEICKNKDPRLAKLINEIIEDNYPSRKIMTEKINLFYNIYKLKRNFEENLKIAEIGSSVDEKYPEEAEPIPELNNLSSYLNRDENSSNDNSSTILSNGFEENFNIKNFDKLDIEDMEEDEKNEILNRSKDSDNPSEVIRHPIISNNKINGINIDRNKLLDMPNLFVKNNKNINKEKINIEKAFPFSNINDIKSQNLINLKDKRSKKYNIFNDERLIKNNKKNKKENNGNKFANTNKNFKIDKKEIPSDIDELVKYITNDDKKEAQNKKKKTKKKKTKKKNKIEDEPKKEETNVDDEDEKTKKDEENDEIADIKKNLVENSINRFKIHKIKFKYQPKWIEELSKYS
jgi:hypothetical protein